MFLLKITRGDCSYLFSSQFLQYEHYEQEEETSPVKRRAFKAHMKDKKKQLLKQLLKYVLEVATFSPHFDPFSCFPSTKFLII